MSQTTHYNLNKPTGSNLVNPLVDTFPNWDIVDENMYKNYNLGVSNATESVSQGVHAIVRTETDLPFFHFTAVANFSSGDTFTLDGVSVNVYTPDGLALKPGAFVSGANILGYFNSTNTSVTLMLNTTSGAVANASQLDGHDSSYYAKASDVTIIGNTDISAIGDGTLTSGLSAVDTKANNNNTHIGNLSSLTTTDKDSIVDAINEVNADVSQIKSDLTDIGTITNVTLKNGTATGSGSTADICDQLLLPKGKYLCCINLGKSYMLDIDFYLQLLINNVDSFANNGHMIFEVASDNTPFKIRLYNNGSGSKTFTASATSNCNIIKIK